MDLRVPSGSFFLLLGAILIVVSFVSGARPKLTDIDVNLYAGIAMAVFGGVLLWLARRQTS